MVAMQCVCLLQFVTVMECFPLIYVELGPLVTSSGYYRELMCGILTLQACLASASGTCYYNAAHTKLDEYIINT